MIVDFGNPADYFFIYRVSVGVFWGSLQFNDMFYYIDEVNYYNRGSLFLVAYLLPAIISVIQIVSVLRYRKELGVGDVLALLSYNLLLFAGAALQAAMQSLLGLIMLLYVFITIGLFVIYIRIQVEKAKRFESELTNARVDIMLSQIQPHFLYNTLTTIENMDSLNQKGLIPFEQELNHVKVYLDFEKMRFKDDLKK